MVTNKLTSDSHNRNDQGISMSLNQNLILEYISESLKLEPNEIISTPSNQFFKQPIQTVSFTRMHFNLQPLEAREKAQIGHPDEMQPQSRFAVLFSSIQPEVTPYCEWSASETDSNTLFRLRVVCSNPKSKDPVRGCWRQPFPLFLSPSASFAGGLGFLKAGVLSNFATRPSILLT